MKFQGIDIKIKDMTIEQKREYNKIRQWERRKKIAKIEKKSISEINRLTLKNKAKDMQERRSKERLLEQIIKGRKKWKNISEKDIFTKWDMRYIKRTRKVNKGCIYSMF